MTSRSSGSSFLPPQDILQSVGQELWNLDVKNMAREVQKVGLEMEAMRRNEQRVESPFILYLFDPKFLTQHLPSKAYMQL